MKRFIDLRGQIYPDGDEPIEQQQPCFAYFCTVSDTFQKCSGQETWESFVDFTNDYRDECGLDQTYERLKGLTPKWALNSGAAR